MKEVLDRLKDTPFQVYLASFSALDFYFDLHGKSENFFASALANLVEIAKEFPSVDYPGLEEADAFVRIEGKNIYIKCLDSLTGYQQYPFTVQNLLYQVDEDKYIDRFSVYGDLRSENLRFSFSTSTELQQRKMSLWRPLTDAAVLVSRYHYAAPDNLPLPPDRYPPLPEKEKLSLLISILTGPSPERGLRLLSKTGFIRKHWPELDEMRAVTHTKDYHPEGDVWEHTLETFRHRKTPDPVVSLGLLLHDIGKVHAQDSNGRRFNKHAQIGASVAERFLSRIGVSKERTEEVSFLIRNHMLPAYISDLPPARTEDIMRSPLFPHLLEVYRCDILSTFGRLNEYYRACKTYRRFLKNKNNPYRSADGKKLLRLYVE